MNRRYNLKYYKVGEVFTEGGDTYKCVKRPPNISHRDACTGCDVRNKKYYCENKACSKFDRKDKNFVWFKKV